MYVYFIIMPMMALVILLGNSLIIVSVLIRTRNLREPQYYFIIALSICDVFIGLDPVIDIVVSSFYSKVFSSLWGSTLFSCFTIVLWGILIFLLLAMTLDRYLRIMKPLKYPVFMTQSRCILLIASVSIIGAVVCLLPLMACQEGGIDTYYKDAKWSNESRKEKTGRKPSCIFEDDAIGNSSLAFRARIVQNSLPNRLILSVLIVTTITSGKDAAVVAYLHHHSDRASFQKNHVLSQSIVRPELCQQSERVL
ncbi:adenosine receptor A2a-like [Saccoglossus kowalevskii]